MAVAIGVGDEELVLEAVELASEVGSAEVDEDEEGDSTALGERAAGLSAEGTGRAARRGSPVAAGAGGKEGMRGVVEGVAMVW